MKLICIGRNYVDHAKELNNKVPTSPLMFIKPETALAAGNKILYPAFTKELHYELEVVLRISKAGSYIKLKDAHKHYDSIGLGIDYTARDIQRECKVKGHPWEKAKGFHNSASLSDTFIDKSYYNLDSIKFSLEKNGKVVQQGDTADLIFGFDFLIHYVSQYFKLEPGDKIYTGTPAGVGPLKTGDSLKGYLEGELILQNSIIAK